MSSAAHLFDIFRRPNFDETIRRTEVRTYYPYVKSFENNDIVEITVNQADSWLSMADSYIVIKGQITKTAGNGTFSLSPNAGAFFFDSVTYEQCGKEMEIVRDPGRISTVRAYLCYEPVASKDLFIAGWNYPNRSYVNPGDNSFRMCIPLKHLFSIFNDYNKVTLGKQTIRLVRARSDADSVIVADADTTAQVTIESIELKVLHIFPNDDIKLQLLQAVKQDTSIIIPFRKWELHELPSLTAGSTQEIWAVKTCSAIESPRYVILGFQTGRYNNKSEDPTLFDHINISNIRLTLNGDYWPNERMSLDFQRNEYAEAYKRYTEFYPSFAGEKHPLLDYSAFKTYALFVIDCSRREDTMKSSTVDIRLDIEAKVGFPPNTRAFCIIIHDSIMEFLPLSEIIRNLS